MGDPALRICDPLGPHPFGSSRGYKYVDLERFENQLRLHLRYAVSKVRCHVKSSLIHILDLDIRTRLDHREYFEVRFQNFSRLEGN